LFVFLFFLRSSGGPTPGSTSGGKPCHHHSEGQGRSARRPPAGHSQPCQGDRWPRSPLGGHSRSSCSADSTQARAPNSAPHLP
jgi:hypothetical protein